MYIIMIISYHVTILTCLYLMHPLQFHVWGLAEVLAHTWNFQKPSHFVQ